ncbi:hypothetical protein N431DRAFT_559128 [Stipitochalara longipes BDJ]|nr:hypothetical protein N431DRAFT_559128 [Stipitochalara longipes BDJ]
MPSKIQLDENLWFLYICLQKSDLKSIDFSAVGAATSLKPPAARMRYTRLRRQIESGTLIGTHGTPFLSSPSSSISPNSPTSPTSLTFVNANHPEKQKKRKRGSGEEGGEGLVKIDGEGNGGGCVVREEEKEGKIKVEDGESDGFESGSDGWDSEDEVPLAKLRKGQLSASVQQTLSHAATSGSYGYDNGSATGSGSERTYEGAQIRSYVPASESRAWTGMIPVGNSGIQQGYPAYWGNGFSGVGAWEHNEKPRKSV